MNNTYYVCDPEEGARCSHQFGNELSEWAAGLESGEVGCVFMMNENIGRAEALHLLSRIENYIERDITKP